MAENSPNPNLEKSPVERDAETLKRQYPLSFLLQLLALVLLLGLIMFVVFYLAIGTERGTKFFVEKVVTETGIDINYGKGNLRDGLWVSDLTIPSGDNVTTKVDNAYVKLGWRALLTGELHLRDAQIEHIKIINSKLPDGKPYDYKTIDLPIDMRLDKASIDNITITQPTRDDFVLTDIDAKNLSWVDSKISVGDGDAVYDDKIAIEELSGDISLEGDYPLDANASVTADFLKKAYIDDLQINAHGSLKRTFGTVKGKYNEHDVKGDFQIQSLDANAPFEAKLEWDKVMIPYFTSQKIELSAGVATFSGITSDIEMRIKSNLTADNNLIPDGHYQGRARITPTSKMDVEFLTAQTNDGTINAKGLLDWEEDFNTELAFSSKDYQIKEILPEEFADYRDYLPEQLQGNLDFIYQTKNSDGNTQYDITLQQDDGELVDVQVIPGHSTRQNPNTPYNINASWQNYHRKNAPDGLGEVNSESGVAKVLYQGKRVEVDTQASISQLSVAPVGDYDIQLVKTGNTVRVNDFNYFGEVGDLAGKGQILLATKKRPLSWQFNANTKSFLLKKYQPNIPIEQVSGQVLASGVMEEIKAKQTGISSANANKTNTQKHSIKFNNANLTTLFDASLANKKATFNNGKGDAIVSMKDGALTDFDVQVDSNVQSEDMPDGHWQVAVAGTPKQMQFDKLRYQGKSGELTATGRLTNDKDVSWDMQADLAKFDVSSITPDNPAIVTGMLNTQGVWRSSGKEGASGQLGDLAVKFDGNVENEYLPAGRLVLDGTTNHDQIFVINKLQHTGDSGKLNATGQVNLKDGYQWQIKGDMQEFNLGYFSTSMPAIITGNINTTGKWNPTLQSQGTNAFKELTDFTLKFDGDVDAENLPSGLLVVDAKGDGQKLTINKLQHHGEAGALNAKGVLGLNTNSYSWQLTGDMQKFNTGYFIKDYPAVVTGKLATTGVWNTPNKSNTTNNSTSTVANIGQLGDFKLNFAGNILDNASIDKLPVGQLLVDASGNAKKLNINRLYHNGQAGMITANGQIDMSRGYQWQLDANMEKFNTGYFVADMPSQLTGKINTSGRWTETQQVIDINQMDLTGSLQGKQLNAQGSLSANLQLPKDMSAYFKSLKGNKLQDKYQQVHTLVNKLDANELMVNWGDNYLTANGNKDNLETKVNLTNLVQISDKLNGELTGGMTITQTSTDALPTIYMDLLANRVVAPNIMVSEGHIKGKLVNLGNSPSQLTLTASDLQYGDISFDRMNAIFNGTTDSHTLNFATADKRLRTSGVLKGSYNSEQMTWQGVLGKGKTVSKYTSLTQQQPAELKVNFKKPKLDMAAHCWKADKQSGSLCLREDMMVSAERGKVNLAIQNIDTGMLSIALPDDMTWESTVSGKAIMNWQKGAKPSVNATLYSDNGRIGLVQEDEGTTLTVPYERVSLIVKSQSDGLKLRTDITSGGRAKGYADVVIDPYQKGKPISGELVLDELNLAVLKPFFPGMRALRGDVSLAGDLSGTLAKPKFDGDFALADGSISVLGLPINLSKVNAIGKVNGNTADLTGRFNSGEGEGQLTGTIDWRDELQAKLKITGEKLYITQAPLLTAEITPDVNVIIKPKQQLIDIQGVVSVPTAIVRPPETNEDVVTKSDDVVVLDRRTIGNLDEILEVSKPWSINANVGIDLGQNVLFKGFGAELPLSGAVIVSQRGQGEMMGKGAVKVARRSNIDAFGQSLELNYAQFKFNGYLQEPQVSIEAANEIEGNTVGMRAKGNLNDLDITVFNDAGLTEQQAMNALVTGRISNSTTTQVSEEGFRSEVTNNIAAAGLSVGLSGTRNVTNQIGRAFGLQSLTLSASGNGDDTNVNVTGYVTPDLYLRYGVGVFNAQSTLSARYQLTRRVYIEATSSVEKFVDVVYSWSF